MKSFEQQLASIYPKLSEKLRQAADFVVANPVDVATRSLRSISNDAKVAPATFTRMARAVGYDGYEELRELMRVSVSKRANTLSSGLSRLQSEHSDSQGAFIADHLKACSNNLESLVDTIEPAQLEEAIIQLQKSKKVLVMGALGSTGVAEYMSYIASFIADNWFLAGRMGASLGSSLIGLSKHDALIVITKPPFANSSVQAVKAARAEGVYVIVITDTHTCPALVNASIGFIIPTQSPHFFSSYVGTLAFVESIIGILAMKGGQAAMDRIENVEMSNRNLEYFQY